MAYLFNGTSDRMTRTYDAGNPAYTWSIWFYPTDNSVDGTIFANYNAGRTNFEQIKYRGSSDDKLEFKTLTTAGGGASGSVVSTGTVNYNAWNHAYVERGITASTRAYISLNGETLVDGGASSFASPVTTGFTTALGRLGGVAPIEYFPGMIAEVATWTMPLHEWGDDRYKILAQRFDPRLMPPDRNDSAGTGIGTLQLLSYSQLIGNATDLVLGTSWTVTTPTVATGTDAHPRIYRNLTE